MTAAPTGRLALAFTDVQGSTQLWERVPEAMREALERHDALMRDRLAAHRGYEVKTEGDAFLVAFQSPVDAVRWCLDMQERLVAEPWPAALLADPAAREEPGFRGLRVRMGVHAGEPVCRVSPTTGRMDYLGPVSNRAARVAAAGHGGQILITETVRAEIARELEAMGSPVLVDTGEHKLKDLERSDRIFQILPASLATRKFPPLKTVAARRSNLPAQTSSFVGRQQELSQLVGMFARGDRLVSLVSLGGTGKTRLALRYGEAVLEEYPGGVWLLELTEARDAAGICSVAGAALGVPLTGGDPAEQLGHAIAGRGRILLLVDNFEQLIDHAQATVGRWLALAPEAHFLVSTQERLRLPGETILELGPLPTSGDERSDAVALFVDRAKAVRPDWVLRDEDAPAVEKIVRELDGIPLAIELAAARIGVLSPAKILERLSRRFELLSGGRGSRAATLRGAIDASWELLKPHEQDALAQASVFHGGFTLEAAEAILDLSAHAGAPWPLDIVESLRDKSLLRSWEQLEIPGEPRFGMFSSIRQYAAEKLEIAGKSRATVERHAQHYLAAATELADGVDGRGGVDKLRRLSVEFENLQAILRDAAGVIPATPESATRALRAARCLDPILSIRGPFALHLEVLDRALLASEGTAVDPKLRAHVLEMRGRARRVRGRSSEAAADLDASMALSRASSDALREARAQAQRAWVDYDLSRLDEAAESAAAANQAAGRAGDAFGSAVALNILGFIERDRGRVEESRAAFERSIVAAADQGALLQEAIARRNLASLLRQQGDLQSAQPLYERALAIYRDVGARAFEGNTLGGLGSLYLELGDADRARQSLEQALAIVREVGNRPSQTIFLGNLGIVHLEQGRPREAKALFERAVVFARETNAKRVEGLYRGYLGAAQILLGAVDEGRADLEAAAKTLRETGAALYLGAIEVLFALVAGPVEIPGILAQGQKLASGSDDVRHALRIVKRAREAAPPL